MRNEKVWRCVMMCNRIGFIDEKMWDDATGKKKAFWFCRECWERMFHRKLFKSHVDSEDNPELEE